MQWNPSSTPSSTEFIDESIVFPSPSDFQHVARSESTAANLNLHKYLLKFAPLSYFHFFRQRYLDFISSVVNPNPSDFKRLKRRRNLFDALTFRWDSASVLSLRVNTCDKLPTLLEGRGWLWCGWTYCLALFPLPGSYKVVSWDLPKHPRKRRNARFKSTQSWTYGPLWWEQR